MITLDRSDPRPIQEQLVDQLRFRIASGAFRVGDFLPSTRVLARRLGISFHTVRKAYARLADQGMVEAVRGSGFRVLEQQPRETSDRLEQGAAVVQAALRSLVGLGLSESEMTYLFEEQLDLVTRAEDAPRFLYVSDHVEAAEQGANHLESLLALPVEPRTLTSLGDTSDAEYAIAPFPLLRAVMERLPRMDVLGVQTRVDAEALSAASRLFEHQTLLLVVSHADAIAPLSRAIKSESGFSGQMLAVAVETGDTRLAGLVRQCDLMLYTRAAKRSVRSHLGSAAVHRQIDLVIPRDEIERLRNQLPG